MSHPRFNPSAVLPKSILKKINGPAADTAPAHAPAHAPARAPARAPPRSATALAPDPREQRNREIALYHANLIQQQKDTEARILDAIIQLLDFPSSPDADPARPSDADASQFLSLITDFQPSDYDSLIEERKCADLCAYALCPKPPYVNPKGGKKKFIIGKGNNLTILPREKVELWCSEDCARRALYVKVQLNEEPAWLRRGGVIDPLELLAEKPTSTPEAESTRHVENLHKAMANLALERGEGKISSKSVGLVKDTIIEKEDVAPAPAPSAGDLAKSLAHMDIEGYEPHTDTAGNLVERDADGDWVL
ncbi:uncharacterized protein K452DRAFT_291105 [Aplosporella prunicola CBS 121167]|uniref:RNA polymerase II subunit B1 CTD phosphatase RPAP2 homolog n=1 Tax=Aplosporella prunicola CBS 121167 TaxID=1176127 RepID=A0A6A6B476_9PEZI|nr:uncharacterized protein K452DRAFT_291105 [Aplosporella prunicola CBS 121167]KAF2138065.1 hypothetical protein K452DRAFT_291105 [Aplosporella prunicola CBS 121167]